MQAQRVLRIAHEFGKFPHEVMQRPVAEFELMDAWLDLNYEERRRDD